MRALTIREPTPAELVAGAELLAATLGFSGADAVPAWLMRATGAAGGLTLGAFDAGGRVVGWSYAFAGWAEGEPHLSSCGLAVAAPLRSRGVGRALKLAQRSLARERGFRSIRWTADPLAVPALRLYLTVLGARMTAYRAGLFDGLREGGGLPQDDVDVLWGMDDGPRDGPLVADERVELPWAREGLSAEEHLAWRLRVRARLLEPLAAGWSGVGVDRDRRSRRSWLLLEAPPS